MYAWHGNVAHEVAHADVCTGTHLGDKGDNADKDQQRRVARGQMFVVVGKQSLKDLPDAGLGRLVILALEADHVHPCQARKGAQRYELQRPIAFQVRETHAKEKWRVHHEKFALRKTE